MTTFGLLGCGPWGRTYVRLLHEIPGARLVAVCDRDAERTALLRDRYGHLAVRQRADDLLADPGIDAVVVATPASTHFEFARRALEAGKHVLVEKPMATSVAEAEALARAARESGRTLLVGFTFLYNAGIVLLRDLVRDPAFGNVHYLHSTRTNLGPVRSDVSVLWDLASHDLAICDFVLGRRPQWVQANAASVLGHRFEDVAFVTLGYPGNVLANVHVSWADPNKVREVVAVGSRRRVVFDDLNANERVRIYEKGISPDPPEAANFGEFRLIVRDGDILSPRVPPTEPLRNQMEHFLACVADGVPPATGVEVGLANVRTLEAIERSLGSRGARVEI